MGERMWLYALENPHPERPIRRLVLEPRAEKVGRLRSQPDRPERTSVCARAYADKLRLTLPEGVEFNALDEYEDLAIDLGCVISARARRSIMTASAGWATKPMFSRPSPSAI